MNIESAKMNTCAVACTVLVKIRRITGSKLCYSSWLPAVSQKIEKTLGKNVSALLFLFTSLTAVLRLRDVSKTYFEHTKMEGTSNR